MVEDIVQLIKKKKELSSLDDNFVAQKVKKVLKHEKKIRTKYEKSSEFELFAKSKECAQLIKVVRKELRVIYGVFQKGKRTKELFGLDEKEFIKTVLMTHQSTNEREPYYDLFYKELEQRIPAPKRVLDIGCGMFRY
jgi:hypothetical protein